MKATRRTDKSRTRNKNNKNDKRNKDKKREERRKQLQSRGAVTIEVDLNEDGRGLALSSILDTLGSRGVTHLCIEGGGRLHGAFLSEQLADDLRLDLWTVPD